MKQLDLGEQPAREHPAVRERLADWYCQHAGIIASTNRMLTAVAKGGMPGAEAALGKLVGAAMNQDIAHYALQLMGEGGSIMEPDMGQ